MGLPGALVKFGTGDDSPVQTEQALSDTQGADPAFTRVAAGLGAKAVSK